jgi:hypothetical protein
MSTRHAQNVREVLMKFGRVSMPPPSEKLSVYEQGVREALAQFGTHKTAAVEAPGFLGKLKSLASAQGLPTAAGLAGAGAGGWDLIHGRGVGGSMGTMIGTGGGGLLGGWGGRMLGQHFGAPGIGQALGTAAGAVAGRMGTTEQPGEQQRMQAQNYHDSPYPY